ncbi:hypothetical protein [Halobacteriovorax sp. HLS]|uniref:hypothetical protein n=1 Tax=Halobacteriovorax sp. HLS TaxID=2234000 RepID=UPI000FDC66F8|nr:hypothetical protein [Halobacteriovorax sp. HLS]
MKKLLLLTSLLLSISTVFGGEESVGRTYIVNTDGTVTFLNKVIPNYDEQGRTYIVEEDGTVTFLDRVAPNTNFELAELEQAKEELERIIELQSQRN